MDAQRSSFVAAVCVAFLAGGVHCVEDQKTEEQPGLQGCIFRGRAFAVGERWVTGPPDKCAKYLCEDDDQIAALTCPWFIPAPGCTVSPGDEDAVYPGCCPLRKCHHATEDTAKPAKESAVDKDAVDKDAVKSPGRSSFRVSLGGDEVPKMTMATTAAATTVAAATETVTETATEAVTETATEAEIEVVTAVTEGAPLEVETVTSTMVPPP